MFSSMDYYSSFSFWGFPWVFCFIGVVLISLRNFPANLWSFYSNSFYTIGWKSLLNKHVLEYVFVVCVAFLILFSNFSGLFPYGFSYTSFITFNICFAFIFWFVSCSNAFMENYFGFFAHFTPFGVPVGMASPLSFMEVISTMLRPLTLALRLSVNISAGHMFMFLLSDGCMWTFSALFLGGFTLGVYFMFESVICLIQGLVFSLLIVEYLSKN